MIKLKTIDCQDERERLVQKKSIICKQRKLEYEQLLDKIRFLTESNHLFIQIKSSPGNNHNPTTNVKNGAKFQDNNSN